MDVNLLPIADAGREQAARDLFPLGMSPDEYAASNAHRWMNFSFDDYRYSDEELTNWIQRLGDILFQRNGAPSIEELRASYLSTETQLQIENEIKQLQDPA